MTLFNRLKRLACFSLLILYLNSFEVKTYQLNVFRCGGTDFVRGKVGVLLADHQGFGEILRRLFKITDRNLRKCRLTSNLSKVYFKCFSGTQKHFQKGFCFDFERKLYYVSLTERNWSQTIRKLLYFVFVDTVAAKSRKEIFCWWLSDTS